MKIIGHQENMVLVVVPNDMMVENYEGGDWSPPRRYISRAGEEWLNSIHARSCLNLGTSHVDVSIDRWDQTLMWIEFETAEDLVAFKITHV